VKGKGQDGVRKVVFLAVLTLTNFCWLSTTLSSPPTRLTVLTLAVPSSDIPLPLQLVLAYGWQFQGAKEGIGYPWWTLGGFGVDFVTDEGSVGKLKSRLSSIWQQTDWDPLVVKQARALSSQQILVWQRDPMKWLRWQARVIAMGQRPESLAPEQPNRVSLDDVSATLKKLSRHKLPLLHFDSASRSWSFNSFASPQHPFTFRFRHALRLPSSRRSHGLWWTVVKGDPAVAMVVGELLGGGTGAKWYQLLRGEIPIAYHAVAQVQWTPVGAELSLYAATSPENLKLARQRAQQLLLSLSRREIDAEDFERAKKLAELRFRQINADPVTLNRLRAIWLMSGHSPDEWENLPERLRSLSLKDLSTFCRSLTPTAEVIALP